jgi:hypothetical protein
MWEAVVVVESVVVGSEAVGSEGYSLEEQTYSSAVGVD